ncbi:MAG TPA: 3-hydroxyacyl-CoA dehydrogenase NAD-binding domain-containing protein, partial [Candidatus Eremiobacteraceae bacterium]|nr:3-hydroxyacyl-CoA dehydrogenase NAD-binding domain-containing protein [Candidatus Eremiobacteraceae bacterium]
MRVLVIGAGQMGSGIAYVCAAAGHSVTISDIDQQSLDRGWNAIHLNLARAIEKGKLTESAARDIEARIAPQLAAIEGSDAD